MRKRDLTLGGYPHYITEERKSRAEVLNGASDSVTKLQRLLKRYGDQITKPGAKSKPFGPYHSAHPMTECIADQKSKKNPPRNPAAVCQYIRSRSKKSASSSTMLAGWDSLSKAEQEGWCRVADVMSKDGLCGCGELSVEEIKTKINDLQRQLDALPKQQTDSSYDILYAEKQAYQEALTAKIKEELGLVKADDGEDPDILEDVAVGGKKPVVDLSIGAGAQAPTTKPPVQPVVVLPGARKGFGLPKEERPREEVAEARRREAVAEARRRETEEREAKKVVRLGPVTPTPDDVGRPE